MMPLFQHCAFLRSNFLCFVFWFCLSQQFFSVWYLISPLTPNVIPKGLFKQEAKHRWLSVTMRASVEC